VAGGWKTVQPGSGILASGRSGIAVGTPAASAAVTARAEPRVPDLETLQPVASGTCDRPDIGKPKCTSDRDESFDNLFILLFAVPSGEDPGVRCM
jgi:hypothetical protein